MNSDHPNIWDRLSLKIYPKYLYPGQYCQTINTLSVAIMHRLPDVIPHWELMDFVYLKPGSKFRYLGLVKTLKIKSDIQPAFTVLETVSPLIDEKKSSGKTLAMGDNICITPYDRQYLAALPDSNSSSDQLK